MYCLTIRLIGVTFCPTLACTIPPPCKPAASGHSAGHPTLCLPMPYDAIGSVCNCGIGSGDHYCPWQMHGPVSTTQRWHQQVIQTLLPSLVGGVDDHYAGHQRQH